MSYLGFFFVKSLFEGAFFGVPHFMKLAPGQSRVL